MIENNGEINRTFNELNDELLPRGRRRGLLARQIGGHDDIVLVNGDDDVVWVVVVELDVVRWRLVVFAVFVVERISYVVGLGLFHCRKTSSAAAGSGGGGVGAAHVVGLRHI